MKTVKFGVIMSLEDAIAYDNKNKPSNNISIDISIANIRISG